MDQAGLSHLCFLFFDTDSNNQRPCVKMSFRSASLGVQACLNNWGDLKAILGHHPLLPYVLPALCFQTTLGTGISKVPWCLPCGGSHDNTTPFLRGILKGLQIPCPPASCSRPFDLIIWVHPVQLCTLPHSRCLCLLFPLSSLASLPKPGHPLLSCLPPSFHPPHLSNLEAVLHSLAPNTCSH